MAFAFNSLSLSEYNISSGGTLAPGRYVCEVMQVEVKTGASGATQLETRLRDAAGAGTVRAYLTLHNPRSEDNTRIGREQLKALLVHGGHPDPDNIGRHGVGSIAGLHVGVIVGEDKYEKDGVMRTGVKVKSFVPPVDIDPAFVRPPSKVKLRADDDIPL